jgi:adenylate kinase family enzyme
MNLQSDKRSKTVTGNTIIHISGFPGSGKTTLGVKIKKKFPKAIVKDTDDFIQHHTKEGKILLRLEKEIDQGKKTISDYKNAWLEIIASQINNFISQFNGQVIILVGSLDNFAPPGLLYNLAADYKFLLDIPMQELLRRSQQVKLYNSRIRRINKTS